MPLSGRTPLLTYFALPPSHPASHPAPSDRLRKLGSPDKGKGRSRVVIRAVELGSHDREVESSGEPCELEAGNGQAAEEVDEGCFCCCEASGRRSVTGQEHVAEPLSLVAPDDSFEIEAGSTSDEEGGIVGLLESEEGERDPDWSFSPVSTISRQSSLGRTPLFDSDSDADDDDVSLYSPITPRFSLSPPDTRRKMFRPTSTLTDPLLSPPSSLPSLALAFGQNQQRRPKARSSSFTTITPFAFDLPRTASSSSSPRKRPPPTSLLTKSLKSAVASLPNLAFPNVSLTQLRAFDWEGLGPNEEYYPQSPWREDGPESHVQLQTFVNEAVLLPQPIAKPPPPPPRPPSLSTPRFISNPAHLLMLSLELSMMQQQKISGPLRPRAVVVRLETGVRKPLSGLRNEIGNPRVSAMPA